MYTQRGKHKFKGTTESPVGDCIGFAQKLHEKEALCWRQTPHFVLPKVRSLTGHQMELREMTTESCSGAPVIVFEIFFVEETINQNNYNLQIQVLWHQMVKGLRYYWFQFIPNIK